MVEKKSFLKFLSVFRQPNTDYAVETVRVLTATLGRNIETYVIYRPDPADPPNLYNDYCW